VSAGDCSASNPVCITATNTCVECTGNSECSGATPYCNTTTDTCVACGSDSQCSSNICTSSGACADPSAIVYVDGGGTDGSACGSAATPCRTISFAVTQTSSTRNRISMGSGAYNDTFVIDDTTTTATSLEIHGHTAGITSATQGSAFVFGTSTTIRDLTFDGGGSAVATVVLGSGSYDLENVTVIDGSAAIESSGMVTANALVIHNAGYAIELTAGSLSIDRATIYNCAIGIAATATATLKLVNAMMYGITGLAVDLSNIDSAMISFSTIIGTRSSAPSAIDCSGGSGTISASIVRAEGSGSSFVPVTGCDLVNSSFVGPVGVAGAGSNDPDFVDPTNNNYHLGSNSPAIDLLTSGPSLDFEGDARPQHVLWDVGADEYKP
jgi:hypothetical protein